MNAKITAAFSVIVALLMLTVPVAVVLNDSSPVSADNDTVLLDEGGIEQIPWDLDLSGEESALLRALLSENDLTNLPTLREPLEIDDIDWNKKIDGRTPIEMGGYFAIGNGNTYEFKAGDELIIQEGGTLILGDTFTIKGENALITMEEGSIIQYEEEYAADITADFCIGVKGSFTLGGEIDIKDFTSMKVDKYVDMSGSLTLGTPEDKTIITIKALDGDKKEISVSIKFGIDSKMSFSGDIDCTMDIPAVIIAPDAGAEGTVTIKDIKADLTGDIKIESDGIKVSFDGNESMTIEGKIITEEGNVTIDGGYEAELNGDFTYTGMPVSILPVYGSEMSDGFDPSMLKDIKGSLKASDNFNLEAKNDKVSIVIEDAGGEIELNVDGKGDTFIDMNASYKIGKAEVKSDDPDQKFDASVKSCKFEASLTVSQLPEDGSYPDVDISVSSEYSASFNKDPFKVVDEDKEDMDAAAINAEVSMSEKATASIKTEGNVTTFKYDVKAEMDNLDVKFKMVEGDPEQKIQVKGVEIKSSSSCDLDEIYAIEIPIEIDVGNVTIRAVNADADTVTDLDVSDIKITTSNKTPNVAALGDWMIIPIEGMNVYEGEDEGGIPEYLLPFIDNAKIEIGSIDVKVDSVAVVEIELKNAVVTFDDVELLILDIEADKLKIDITDATGTEGLVSMSNGDMTMGYLSSEVTFVSGDFELKNAKNLYSLVIEKEAKVKVTDTSVWSLEVKDPKSVTGNFLLDKGGSVIEIGTNTPITYVGWTIVDEEVLYEDYPVALSVEFGDALSAKYIPAEGFKLVAGSEEYVAYNVETGVTAAVAGLFGVNLDTKEYTLEYGNSKKPVKAFTEVDLDVPETLGFIGWTDGVNTYYPYDIFRMPAKDIVLTDVIAAVPEYKDGTVSGADNNAVIANAAAIEKAKEAGKLTIITKNAKLDYNAAAIDNLYEEEINVQVTVSDRSEQFPAAVGNGMVVSIDSNYIFFGEGAVKVTVDYELKGQDAGAIRVYYLDSYGSLTEVSNVMVGEVSDGKVPVTMELGHFSDYVVKTIEDESGGNGGGINTTFIIIGIVAVIAIAGAAALIIKKR